MPSQNLRIPGPTPLPDAVREAGRPRRDAVPEPVVLTGEVARKGHLRVLRGSREA